MIPSFYSCFRATSGKLAMSPQLRPNAVNRNMFIHVHPAVFAPTHISFVNSVLNYGNHQALTTS